MYLFVFQDFQDFCRIFFIRTIIKSQIGHMIPIIIISGRTICQRKPLIFTLLYRITVVYGQAIIDSRQSKILSHKCHIGMRNRSSLLMYSRRNMLAVMTV